LAAFLAAFFEALADLAPFLAALAAFLPPFLATTTAFGDGSKGGRSDGFVAPPTRTLVGVFFPRGFGFGFVESS
jgi:hypothetical protein